MINSEFAKIEAIVLHKTGNKLNEEGIRFSKEPVRINELLEELLIKYFFSPFKQNEYYNLSHETDINLNEVYSYVSAIFDDPENLFEQSVNIAKHLYEQSVHPKIRGGELYVVYFKDCNIDGEPMDAVGIFKSETRETYLKIYPDGDGFGIDSDARRRPVVIKTKAHGNSGTAARRRSGSHVAQAPGDGRDTDRVA